MNAYQKISVFAIVSGLLALQAGCQQQAKVPGEPAAPGVVEQAKGEAKPAAGEPRIEFQSLVYDFGKVGPGQKLDGQFKFTNAGDAPLKITKVEKCCGAVTKLDKEQLAPGESGVLEVTYTSSRMPGAMGKKLYVNTNDPATPKATLTIKAETVLKVDYEPKSLKMLLKDGQAECPKITLSSTDNKPFSITSFQASNDCLTAEIDPVVGATKFVLEPKADMEKLKRTSTGRITIGLAFSEPDTPPETITIIFQAVSRFTIMPSTLMMLYSDPAKPARKSLWITNNYGEDFEVESTASAQGHIKVLSQNKTGNRWQCSLEISAPEGESKRFEDTFSVKLKGGETLEIKCRGIFRASTAKPAGSATWQTTSTRSASPQTQQ